MLAVSWHRGQLVYAISLSCADTPHGLGFANFVNSYDLPEFIPAFKHVLVFEAIWLVSQSVLVVVLALMVHNLARRTSATFRFIFYLPGAMAGAASVVIWLFMFTRSTSSAFILHDFITASWGNSDCKQSPLDLRHHGFLDRRGRMDRRHVRGAQQIPNELIEAAEIDGSTRSKRP